MYNNLLVGMLGAVMLLAYPATSIHAQQDSTATKDKAVATSDSTSTKKKEEKKPETKYDKLFKGKKVETAKGGFGTLHKMDGKVYLELPRRYFGERMLLGATISGVTDPSYLSVGMKNASPIHLWFEQQDSMIVAKTPNTIVYKGDKLDERLEAALKLNYRDPVSMGFRLEAYTPDSTAVVFDVTSLMGRANSLLPVFPERSGSFTISSTPKSDLAFIKELKSFPTNVSVKAELGYSYSTQLMGMVTVRHDIPTTVDVTYSLSLMPKDKMRPRFADSRVGVFSSSKVYFAQDQDYSRNVYLAHRWRLEPADPRAYAAGKPSEPKKPIIFYLDPTFPKHWREPIRRGVLMWNEAFERIGFRNAIQLHDYPMGDKSFDPDNLAYSCIRYIPTKEENASGPSWVDPETGEILNATILVFNNIERLLHRWRFVQTAAVDPSVRADKLPQDKFAEALTYSIAHEVGHTLGFMHNMAASSAYDTEQLRSASFTQKHGISASIMDYARFNYVAQPGDKGLSLYQSVLGPYDYHLVEWSYKHFSGKTPGDEARVLEALVDKRVSNPHYRYAPEQSYIYDPSVLSNDLGNDAIKSSEYGIRNLNYIQANLGKWIKDDPDSQKKQSLVLAIAQQYHTYLKNVMHLVGGVYYNDSKEGSGIPRYRAVDKERQREALRWSMATIRGFQDFAPRALERKGFISVSYYDQLLEFIALDLFNLQARVMTGERLLGEEAYTQREFFDDLYNEVFRTTLSGGVPNHMEMMLEKTFVERARLGLTDPKKSAPSMPIGLRATDSYADAFFALQTLPPSLHEEQRQQLAAYAYGNPGASLYPKYDLASINKFEMYYYEALGRLRTLLPQRIAEAKSTSQRAHYELMLYRIEHIFRTIK